jgi:hypothetical protein
MSFNHFLRLSVTLLLGLFCLSNAWASGKLPPKNASDYGGIPFTPCGSSTSGDVTATCYLASSGVDTYSFNFTVDPASPSLSVTSFVADLGTGFDGFGLLFGCSSSSSTGTPVPCDPNSPPPALPFDVTGPSTLGTGDQTFDFVGFTGNYSGDVTVYFDCPQGTTCAAPSVASIATETTTTPEPRFYAFLTLAVLLGAGIFRRASFSR